jgi:2-keto-4-pentenoate hydratase/2-oxohepta-3-ene-1,7-dioic acid hydratase in catechol pathway
MRFASFLDAEARMRVGVVRDQAVYACPAGRTLLELLGDEVALREAGEAALAAPAFVTAIDELELLAPVPVPPSFRDFLSFEQHLRTVSGRAPDADWYRMPVFYFSNPAGIFGPRSLIPVPPGCTNFDYELEVAAVIGRAGFNLSPDEAEAHIAGYSVLGDFTARDLQAAEMKLMLGPAKGKDTASSCGPWLVTPDELHPRRSERTFDLEMTASVNGREYSRGRLDTMHWSFPELVAYASRGTHVKPGDIIGSGTVGRGCILELSLEYGEAQYPWLQPGDEVVLEVEALGALTHRIVRGAELHPLRDSRSPAAALTSPPRVEGPKRSGS